ncbi:hypothetical protein ACJX0J_036286 [Zea mays]
MGPFLDKLRIPRSFEDGAPVTKQSPFLTNNMTENIKSKSLIMGFKHERRKEKKKIIAFFFFGAPLWARRFLNQKWKEGIPSNPTTFNHGSESMILYKCSLLVVVEVQL